MSRLLRTLLGGAVLCAIAYGLYRIGLVALTLFGSLDKTVEAAFIAAFATIVVSVISVVLSNLYVARLRTQKELRAKKVPVYERLLELIFRFMNQAGTTEPVPFEEFKVLMNQLNQEFMVWGADDVVKAWVKWRRHAIRVEEHGTNPEALFLIEDLIFAIRRDLGHANNNLGEGDMLSIFVNDIESVLPRKS